MNRRPLFFRFLRKRAINIDGRAGEDSVTTGFPMKNMKNIVCIVAMLAAGIACAQETQKKEPTPLEQAEAQIAAAPNDPKPHYRKCQALFAAGKQQESIDYAKVAMEKFIKAKSDLAWMLLGSVKTDKYRIDVHYNMGPRERAKPKQLTGIVRPYSFRVWELGDGGKLVKKLDFEIGYLDGEPITAAIGEMAAGGSHSNYGALETNADFATVLAKVMSVLGEEDKTAAESGKKSVTKTKKSATNPKRKTNAQ